MGIEIEAQDEETHKQIRARELQFENTQKLEELNEMVENVSLEGIESNTNDIKAMVITNLEAQPNIEDIVESLNKISQGITDIKRSQTNINKKINELQDTVKDLEGE